MQSTDQFKHIPFHLTAISRRKFRRLQHAFEATGKKDLWEDPRVAEMIDRLAAAQSAPTVSWSVRFLVYRWIVRSAWVRRSKRAFDVLVSILLLPLVMPVMILTAIAIKLDSAGPVFFRQERVGKWGRPFQCFKFRSMYVGADSRKAELLHLNEADGVVFKMKKDPRVTRVGRLIRKLSIDELPQIFNVIQGLSLIHI